MSEPVRVLIADDDASTRAGVRLSLEGHGFDVCGEADNRGSALELAGLERPDVCLIEADLPGGGIEAAEAILEDRPGTSVVMLCGAVNHDRLFAAVRAGARGYLPKDMDPARLPMVLRGVLDGEAALPRAAVGALLDTLRTGARGRHAAELARLGVDLTAREREVLELLDGGHDTAGIGQMLGISAVTVRRHVSEILRKLEVPNRDSALRVLREARA